MPRSFRSFFLILIRCQTQMTVVWILPFAPAVLRAILAAQRWQQPKLTHGLFLSWEQAVTHERAGMVCHFPAVSQLGTRTRLLGDCCVPVWLGRGSASCEAPAAGIPKSNPTTLLCWPADPGVQCSSHSSCLLRLMKITSSITGFSFASLFIERANCKFSKL